MKAIKVDACGISCPGPIMKLKKSMEELADGERLEIVATDAGFPAMPKHGARLPGTVLSQ